MFRPFQRALWNGNPGLRALSTRFTPFSGVLMQSRPVASDIFHRLPRSLPVPICMNFGLPSNNLYRFHSSTIARSNPSSFLFESSQPPEVYDNLERMLMFRLENSPEDVSIEDFNDMIIGFGKIGQQDRSLRLFEAALKENFSPNDDTYVGLMSAFGYVGDTENALETFRQQLLIDQKPNPKSVKAIIEILIANKKTEKAFEFITQYPYPLTPISVYVEFAKLQPFPAEMVESIGSALIENGHFKAYGELSVEAVRSALRDGQEEKVLHYYFMMKSIGLVTTKLAEIVFLEAGRVKDWDILSSLLADLENLSPAIAQGLIAADPERALAHFLSLEATQLNSTCMEHIITSKLRQGELADARKYLQLFFSKHSSYTPRICNALLEYHGERKDYGELKQFLDLTATRPDISNPRTYRLLIKYCLRGGLVAEAVRSFQQMNKWFPTEATPQDFQTMILICSKHKLPAMTLSLTRESRKRFANLDPAPQPPATPPPTSPPT